MADNDRPTKRAKSERGASPAETPEPKRKSTKQAKIPVLPWMRTPVSTGMGSNIKLQDVQGLAHSLSEALQTGAVQELFPAQAAVWRETAGGHSTAHDICIAAPTGSGKTLAYALPIINALSGGCNSMLRALVVLPSRDLAVQVFQVFKPLCEAAGVRAVLLAAQCSQALETAALLGSGNPATFSSECWQLSEEPAYHQDKTWPHSTEDVSGSLPQTRQALPAIVIATPGRLVAHLQSTPGFSMLGLRFLVVDEADRLLRQAFDDWLAIVMAQLEQSQKMCGHRAVKLIASATLTRDPAKVERFHLHSPRLVAADTSRQRLPKSLKEWKVPCSSGEAKPLALLAILQDLADQPTLIFTSSVEATHRLCTLLLATTENALRVAEFSSFIDARQRAANLAEFKSGQRYVLVASDGMARGMDVECSNVVNYDTPVHSTTYVHRAGRTARAGRFGQVFSLLRPEEMRHFKAMLRKIDNAFVKDYLIREERLKAIKPAFEIAFRSVRDEVIAQK
ncbi:hypothetical protein WJX74_007298 [Apatococcus lobatus]|uniref:RNA helicase n=2 Tax=Apatococcus TaxID=904362 RepID=A0AAW1SWY0_9CHLO